MCFNISCILCFSWLKQNGEEVERMRRIGADGGIEVNWTKPKLDLGFG